MFAKNLNNVRESFWQFRGSRVAKRVKGLGYWQIHIFAFPITRFAIARSRFGQVIVPPPHIRLARVSFYHFGDGETHKALSVSQEVGWDGGNGRVGILRFSLSAKRETLRGRWGGTGVTIEHAMFAFSLGTFPFCVFAKPVFAFSLGIFPFCWSATGIFPFPRGIFPFCDFATGNSLFPAGIFPFSSQHFPISRALHGHFPFSLGHFPGLPARHGHFPVSHGHFPVFRGRFPLLRLRHAHFPVSHEHFLLLRLRHGLFLFPANIFPFSQGVFDLLKNPVVVH